MNKSLALFAATALLVSLSCVATTAPAVAKSAPLGYQLMCLKTPAECKSGGKSQVSGSSDIMATLKRVNRHINASITPRRDKGADVWTANATAGDCEDFVLAKRRQLINAGFPPSSLRIAYVKTRKGEDHAILVVSTAKGKLVLDNLTNTIKPLAQTGYRVISMQGTNGKAWS